MNISFKSHFPWPGPDGKPELTYFEGRIITALADLRDAPVPPLRKLHTIRRDQKDGTCRYREGMDLHMVTGSRMKPDRFAVARCTGVQPVLMGLQTIPNVVGRNLFVDIASGPCSNGQIKRLAENDGLSLDQFTKWFMLDIIQHGPFTGHIIHWTDLRY